MTKTIQISDQLAKELESALKKKKEKITTDEYVELLLKKALLEENKSVYQPHEEEKIKDRLKSLGYID